MEKVYEFLKAAGTYYLATLEGDQPRVRPFGTIDLFEDKLYIQTGKVKDVSKQIHANPKIEICAFKDGTWLRVAAKAYADDRIEAQEHMLAGYPFAGHVQARRRQLRGVLPERGHRHLLPPSLRAPEAVAF